MSYTKTQWNNDTAPAINETNLNKIEQGIYDNDSHIGDLTTLTTTAKTSTVSAINEVNGNIGTLSNLTTTANTDLVSAINEVDSHADTNATNIGDLTTLTTTAKSNVVSAVNELDSLKATKDVATTSANGLMSASDKDLLNQLDTKRFATRVSDNAIPDGGTATFTVTDNGKYIFFNAHPYRTGADFLNIHPNLGLNATNIFGSTTMTYTLNGTTLTIKSEGQCRGWLFVLNMTS